MEMNSSAKTLSETLFVDGIEQNKNIVLLSHKICDRRTVIFSDLKTNDLKIHRL